MPEELCNCDQCQKDRAYCGKGGPGSFRSFSGKKKVGLKKKSTDSKKLIRGIPATIEWYNRRLGYGFVFTGSVVMFFHHSTVNLRGFSPKTKLKKGQKVSVKYKIVKNKGISVYQATEVKII